MPLADRVVRKQIGPVDLAVVPTGVRDVVTIQGSLETSPDYSAGGDLIQDWAVRTLDKGTRKRDRFQVAQALEDVGASIGFSSSAGRVRFSARMLRRDFDEVAALLFEQLMLPAFEEEELRKSHDRIAASIQHSRSDAGYRASVALRSALFPSGHPNAMIEPDAEAALLETLTTDSVTAFHTEQILASNPRLVIVGDVRPEDCRRAVEAVATAWPGAAAHVPSPVIHPPSGPGESRVPLADRDNLEVRWGHSMPFGKTDEAYLPAYLASFILGGNFSARLMAEVRDKQGLTYGIGSSLKGIDTRFGGMWSVHVTLSKENLNRGIAATESVLAEFAQGGCLGSELEENQDTLAGSYKVRLATTSGIAGTLLGFLEDGRSETYLDDYAERVRSITLQQVNEAVARFFEPGRLFRSVAGTFPED